MTKTLTEQWRDGMLPRGSYYIRIITGIEKSDFFEGKKFCFWTDYEVEEVLAPVPSYTEVKEMSQKLESLETKLAIALKGLKFISFQSDRKDMYDCAKWTLMRLEELDK